MLYILFSFILSCASASSVNANFFTFEGYKYIDLTNRNIVVEYLDEDNNPVQSKSEQFYVLQFPVPAIKFSNQDAVYNHSLQTDNTSVTNAQLYLKERNENVVKYSLSFEYSQTLFNDYEIKMSKEENSEILLEVTILLNEQSKVEIGADKIVIKYANIAFSNDPVILD